MMGPEYTRGHSKQGGIQIAGLFTTIGIAILSGAFTGLTLRIPKIWGTSNLLFHDSAYFRYKLGENDVKVNIEYDPYHLDRLNKIKH